VLPAARAKALEVESPQFLCACQCAAPCPALSCKNISAAAADEYEIGKGRIKCTQAVGFLALVP